MIPRRLILLVLAIESALIFAGCATPPDERNVRTVVISPDQGDNLGGVGIESQDIRTAASRFAGEIIALPQIAQKKDGAGIAISPIVNSSSELIDKDLFSTRLRIELNKYSQGRVRFFAQGAGRDVRSEVLQAKDAEQLGQLTKDSNGAIVDSSMGIHQPNSGLAGVDFILTGELQSLTKAVQGGDRSEYISMTFQLVDALSNQIIWDDSYEVKKVSKIPSVQK